MFFPKCQLNVNGPHDVTWQKTIFLIISFILRIGVAISQAPKLWHLTAKPRVQFYVNLRFFVNEVELQ
jgi:hypothetical protein